MELQKRVNEGEGRLKQQQVGTGWLAGWLVGWSRDWVGGRWAHTRIQAHMHHTHACMHHPPPKALYEAVRADRNLYSKTLIEAQDEIHELKRKFKIQAHQVGGGLGVGSTLWTGRRSCFSPVQTPGAPTRSHLI